MDLLSTSYLLVTLTDIDIKTEEKENVRLIYVHEFVLKPLFKLLLFDRSSKRIKIWKKSVETRKELNLLRMLH